MITRRGFFGLLGGALGYQAARRIYVLPPAAGWKFPGGIIAPGEALFFLPPPNFYRYVYRNSITGCVSDPNPRFENLVRTFAYPEVDVIDIYERIEEETLVWNGVG